MTTFTQTSEGTFVDKEPGRFTSKLKMAGAIVGSALVLSLVFSGLMTLLVVGSIVAGVSLLFRK